MAVRGDTRFLRSFRTIRIIRVWAVLIFRINKSFNKPVALFIEYYWLYKTFWDFALYLIKHFFISHILDARTADWNTFNWNALLQWRKIIKRKKGLIASKCGDEIGCDNPDNLCFAYESMNIELPLSFILTHVMRYMYVEFTYYWKVYFLTFPADF